MQLGQVAGFVGFGRQIRQVRPHEGADPLRVRAGIGQPLHPRSQHVGTRGQIHQLRVLHGAEQAMGAGLGQRQHARDLRQRQSVGKGRKQLKNAGVAL
ncbi:hypothetical protein D9M72_644660 [compost metagenome]